MFPALLSSTHCIHFFLLFLPHSSLKGSDTVMIFDIFSVRRTILSMSFRGRVAFSVAFIFALFTVGMFAGEIYIERTAKQFLAPQQASNVDPLLETDITTAETDLSTFRFDPVIPSVDPELWRTQNNFTNHTQGMRTAFGLQVGRQIPRPARPDAKRVLVVGDSYAWGHGLEDADSMWPALLELELNDDGGTAYEVITLARQGASHMEMSDWLTEERIQTINPDIVIIGFVLNDTYPSFRETTLCKPLNTCIIDGFVPKFSSEEEKRLIACIEGEDTIFSKLIKFFSGIFPQLANKAARRYCSAERFNDRDFRENELEMINSPENSKYWPLYLDATRHISKVLDGVPTFLFPYSQDLLNHDASRPVINRFNNLGIGIIPGPVTAEVYATKAGQLLWVDPIDNHPGRVLTTAFAVDVARYIRSEIGSAQAPSPQAQDPIISNYSPVTMKVSSPDSNEMTIRSAIDPDDQGFRSKGEESVHNPCPLVGRPYSRVMFDPHLGRVRIASHLTVSIETVSPKLLLPLSHGADGREMFGSAIPVRSRAKVRLPEGTIGVLVAETSAGCNIGSWISSGFTLTVERKN